MRKTRVQLYCCVSVQSAAKRPSSPLEEGASDSHPLWGSFGETDFFFSRYFSLEGKVFSSFFITTLPSYLCSSFWFDTHPSVLPVLIYNPHPRVCRVFTCWRTHHTRGFLPQSAKHAPAVTELRGVQLLSRDTLVTGHKDSMGPCCAAVWSCHYSLLCHLISPALLSIQVLKIFTPCWPGKSQQMAALRRPRMHAKAEGMGGRFQQPDFCWQGRLVSDRGRRGQWNLGFFGLWSQSFRTK